MERDKPSASPRPFGSSVSQEVSGGIFDERATPGHPQCVIAIRGVLEIRSDPRSESQQRCHVRLLS